MKKLLLILAVSAFFLNLEAQQVEGPFEFKSGRASGSTTEKKMKKAAKRVYINMFQVAYQILYNDWEQTREGVNVGKTKATLTVGFEGVDEVNFQAITDEIYQAYVNQLKGSGFEIVSIDEASKTKKGSKAQRTTGGKIDYASKSGYAVTTPTGFEYLLVKDKLINNYLVTMGEDMIGVDVRIEIPFMIDSEAGASKLASKAVGGVSKVVASPALRISEKSGAWYATTGANVHTPLKSDVMISGVFQDEKFKSTSVAQTNTSYRMGQLTNVYKTDVDTEKIQVAKGDPAKYTGGVTDAMKQFIKASTDIFVGFANGD